MSTQLLRLTPDRVERFGNPLEREQNRVPRIPEPCKSSAQVRQGLRRRPPKRRRRRLTRPDKAAAPIPDLFNRDFHAEAIDQRWCGDLTEIPTDEGKLYLATLLDLGSRRLPGIAMGEHHDSAVAKAALCMAAAVRGSDVAGVVFHSDKAESTTGSSTLEPAGRWGDPVDGPGRLGVGQRCGRELGLDPRARTAARSRLAIKDQARREISHERHERSAARCASRRGRRADTATES